MPCKVFLQHPRYLHIVIFQLKDYPGTLKACQAPLFPVSFKIMQSMCTQIIICNYNHNMQMCPLPFQNYN